MREPRGVRQDRNLLSDADFLDVNLLTVIASESYERFAESLQKDIETDLRERPIVINDAFFAKTCVPADKLGPEYAGLGDVSFSKDEARDIVYALTVDRLIDRDGKLTDKYKEEHFGKDAVELLPEPLRKKVPAIRLVLDSVVEGTTKVLIGNALKRKVHGNPLNANWQKKEFQELWRRINTSMRIPSASTTTNSSKTQSRQLTSVWSYRNCPTRSRAASRRRMPHATSSRTAHTSTGTTPIPVAWMSTLRTA